MAPHRHVGHVILPANDWSYLVRMMFNASHNDRGGSIPTDHARQSHVVS